MYSIGPNELDSHINTYFIELKLKSNQDPKSFCGVSIEGSLVVEDFIFFKFGEVQRLDIMNFWLEQQLWSTGLYKIWEFDTDLQNFKAIYIYIYIYIYI